MHVKNPASPVRNTTITGIKGVYVGTTVYLMNPSTVPTSSGNWWGEGDEKVFVDDDRVPSIFGTGSEDYFNYSWSSPDIFAFPYCGQPYRKIKNQSAKCKIKEVPQF